MNNTLSIVLAIIVCVILAMFAFPIASFITGTSRMTAQELIGKLSKPGASPLELFRYRALMLNSGALKRPDPNLLPPLHFLIRNCFSQNPKNQICIELLMFVVKAGYDLNGFSDDGQSLTPLHEAVLICDDNLAFMLIGYGADRKKVAGPGPFSGQTPLEFLLKQSPSCPKNSMLETHLRLP